MYQGKFDKKHKGTTTSTSELVAARNSEKTARESERQPAAPRRTPAPQQEKSVRKQPAAEAAAPRKQQPVRQEAPQSAKRRGPRLGGVIFYTFYFMFIFLFFVGTYFGLTWLQGWLMDFEAAQPTTKAGEVFEALFTDPDWGALYDAAGIKDTPYEGKEAFVTYMENLVGDQELTYNLTSSGLSKDKKYFVNLGSKKLAYFTLTGGSDAQSITDITDVQSVTDIRTWELGEIGLYYERANGYRIQTVDGHIPSVNGIPLTEDHIIQKSAMKEDTTGFLPTGYSSATSCIYEITDLMVEPVITVADSLGNPMEVNYDESTGMYVEPAKVISISDEEREMALDALKVYAKYQIKEASGNELGKHFLSSGEAYKNITKTVLAWTKGNRGISFANDSATNYRRYGDDMFSVYVTTELTINLTDGGTQVKPINSTLLFENTKSGWRVTKMTNANLSETTGKVRLTFMNGDTVLSKDFYDIESEKLDTPLLSVPEGKVFSGWYRETVKADGSREQFLMFIPDENGVVTLQSGTVLQPMVLYPLFEDASAVEPAATEGE